MTTEPVASTEPVSTQEPVSQPVPEVKKVEPQPLTEDRVQQLIAEATKKAIEEGKTLGKREMQGIKDREVADIKRKAEIAERRARIYEGSFEGLDEDTKAQLELRRLRGETELYRTRAQEDTAQRQQEEQAKRLEQSLKDEVTALGIDPTDKRIDYANDAKDYFDGRKRFSESLSKIVKDDRTTLAKTLKTEADNNFKKMEAEFRKKYGLDSQDTTTSAGVVDKSDADFMTAWGNYDVPDTKENRTRYENIKKKYY